MLYFIAVRILLQKDMVGLGLLSLTRVSLVLCWIPFFLLEGMCGWFLCQQIELSSRNSCLFSRFEIHTRTMGRGELRQVSPRKMDVSLSLGLSLISFYLYKVRIESRPQDS